MDRTNIKQLKRVKVIQYLLPIILFVIVLFYETWEHLYLDGNFHWDIHFTSEVLFFGIIGPSAVFATTSYIVKLLEKHIQDAQQLEILNLDLEQKVAERTELLEERNNELSVANKELQQLDQLKSDFVSLVSHELRGPLTTLNGGIEMALQEGEGISPEVRRLLEIMSGESQRLTTFVQTILDVSRLDAGKLTLNLGPVAIKPLIKRVIDVVLAGKKREVIYTGDQRLPLAWGDEIYLEKILSNLIANADKFSAESLPVEFNAKLLNGCIEVSVIDHGPGIPKDVQNQVFKRFLRLETGDKISSKGWGLGLHFAQALAEAQGCSLSLVSPVYNDANNPGSAFTLSIPVDIEESRDG